MSKEQLLNFTKFMAKCLKRKEEELKIKLNDKKRQTSNTPAPSERLADDEARRRLGL